jgi:lipopolysaccharide export system protein LptC
MVQYRKRDNLHSKVVVFLKVLLPLAALALLSTLFLFSPRLSPEDALPYAEVDVEDRLSEPRMTGAGFSGMTADGAALTFSASEAKPGVDGAASARGILGAIETSDGVKNEIAAVSVVLDPKLRQIRLSEGVELKSSTGLLLQMQGLDIAMDQTLVQSHGAVSVAGPFGQLTAQDFSLSAAEGQPNVYVMVFKGRVRLLYQPEK